MHGPQLKALARQIARHMTSTVHVSTFTQELDRDTGEYVTVETIHWQGKGHVRPTSNKSVYVDIGGQDLPVKTYDVWLPVDATLPDDPDVKVVTHTGLQLTITDRPYDDWQTSRRLVCQTTDTA